MTQTPWGEIEHLVLAAAERTNTEECAQFVQTNCQDSGLATTMTALVQGTGLPAPRMPVEEGPPLSAGSRVGPYLVERRLGRGGMGEVFLARDSRLDRPVALKCLVAAGVAPGDLRDRVIREARMAARINHPHVAAVHDLIEHDGRTFMVMEYVEGESLAVVLRNGPLQDARVVNLGRQLAAALASAHRVGVIHRDLKPANIQVTPDGPVKVLDFGIATAYAALATAATRAAAAVEVAAAAGTPGYMSPEQTLGREVDERSDIFSLSVVLFEMATGRRPFDSRDPWEIMVATMRGLPRADAAGRAVPENLADLIATGLAADPRNRFQSAAEMGAALEAMGAPPVPNVVPLRRRILGAALVMAIVPVLLWALGRISSAGFNNTLERSGAFATERAVDDFVWGARSLVAPLVYGGLASILVWTLRFAVRVLALWAPAGRRIEGIAQHARTIAERMAFHDPVVLAQALATLGLLGLALVAWRFNGLLLAWGTTLSTGLTEGGRLWPLRPDNENERVLYRAVLTVLLLVFSAGLARVIQLRRRLGTRRGAGGLAALAAVIVSLLLLTEVPYRIFFKSTALRVEFRGRRCYVVGEDTIGGRSLLYCPESAPPRNVIVDTHDPAIHPSGAIESIFTPPSQ
jgi:Protein kinase domain